MVIIICAQAYIACGGIHEPGQLCMLMSCCACRGSHRARCPWHRLLQISRGRLGQRQAQGHRARVPAAVAQGVANSRARVQEGHQADLAVTRGQEGKGPPEAAHLAVLVPAMLQVPCSP